MKIVPQYETTFPFFRVGQRAFELYPRRRLVGFISQRQYLARRATNRRLFRGLLVCSPVRGFLPWQHELVWTNTVGCYATDAQGQPWATFQAIGHTYACQNCGAQIDRGWARGRLGEETYYCSKHVHISHEQPTGKRDWDYYESHTAGPDPYREKGNSR